MSFPSKEVIFERVKCTLTDHADPHWLSHESSVMINGYCFRPYVWLYIAEHGENITEDQKFVNTCMFSKCARPDHYAVVDKNGDLSWDDWQRVFRKCSEKVGDCVLWTGKTSKRGVPLAGRYHAHVLAYLLSERKESRLRSGLEVVQDCGNRLCVKTDHLVLNHRERRSISRNNLRLPLSHEAFEIIRTSTCDEEVLSRVFIVTPKRVKAIRDGTDKERDSEPSDQSESDDDTKHEAGKRSEDGAKQEAGKRPREYEPDEEPIKRRAVDEVDII